MLMKHPDLFGDETEMTPEKKARETITDIRLKKVCDFWEAQQ